MTIERQYERVRRCELFQWGWFGLAMALDISEIGHSAILPFDRIVR